MENTHTKPRKIIGFSLKPELASEVKQEAARRELSLKKLFEEMWEAYKARQKPDASQSR